MEIKEEYPTTFIQIYQKNPRIVRKDGTYFKVPVMAFIMLVRQEGNEFKYIDSVADNDVHMAIEVNLKPGTYYIFSDVNYRYGNPDYKSYGYTLTCYARKGKQPIVLENVTQKVDRKKYLEVSLFDYCKKKLGTPTKDKSGIEVYISENFKREVPFHVFCFVNPKNEPMKVELKVESEEKNKKKCFCIYNDKIASEFDSSVIKSICPKSATCILVMGYSRDSKYKCRYDILPPNDKRTYENNQNDNGSVHSSYKYKRSNNERVNEGNYQNNENNQSNQNYNQKYQNYQNINLLKVLHLLLFYFLLHNLKFFLLIAYHLHPSRHLHNLH